MSVAEGGSATVWVVLACLVTWSVATLAVSIGGVIGARHRAASAADLAALAGAHVLADGVGDPCPEAERVAAATRARLVACEPLADGSLEVVVEAALPRLVARWTRLPPARARARAGTIRSVAGDLRRPAAVRRADFRARAPDSEPPIEQAVAAVGQE